ncbi:13467_t:CDS:2 [Acaulospora colombiana]|uniref:13467_t:CDS:1 n=1 Tax=Acaulospora colombiana TaxID=27376 RepID=A0ACA9KY58_9GLOM|nr:13467_t:CDS:2 [Acaulospora colombiana]
MDKSPLRRLGFRVYEAVTGAIYTHINPSPSVKTLDERENKSEQASQQTVPKEDQIISLDVEEDSCNGCADPCSFHPNYPYLKIDRKSTLDGTVKPYVKHVLISTGKSDWQAHIEDESCSLAAHLHKVIKSDNVNRKDCPKKEKKNKVEGTTQNQDDSPSETEKPRIVITNSSRQNTDDDAKGNDILLFPDNILIKNVTPKQATEIYKKFLSSSVYEEKESTNGFAIEQMPYKAVIVICSHRRRDKRCGITGPILKEEFDKKLNNHSKHNVYEQSKKDETI